jgi:hypothetical protein
MVKSQILRRSGSVSTAPNTEHGHGDLSPVSMFWINCVSFIMLYAMSCVLERSKAISSLELG